MSGVDHIDHLSTVYSEETLAETEHFAHLNDKGDLELFESPLVGTNLDKDVLDGSGFLPRDSFI